MTNEEINKYVDMGDIEKGEEITTERAIVEVYRWVSIVEHESYEYDNLTPKVLDMAIRALKNEQTDGDLISRDFMKKLGATCIAERNEKGELVAISSIDNLPSAENTAK